jgi:hypothetical protein
MRSVFLNSYIIFLLPCVEFEIYYIHYDQYAAHGCPIPACLFLLVCGCDV